MKKQEKKPGKSRRDFLVAGLSAGAGIALGGGLLSAKSGNASESGEKIKLLSPDGKVVEVDKSNVNYESTKPAIGREARKGLPGRKFVMLIDLAKCKNARKCVDVCQEGHHLPKSQEWINIYLLKDSPESAPYWFPRPCFHCDNPMCVSVCPVGATYKRSDGIVLVNTDRCIGCKFCMTGCPYSARVFHWEEPDLKGIEDVEYSPETAIPPQEGTVGKCVFCADLLKQNKLPRCVSGCPMGVIYFGDINEDTVTNGTETVVFSEIMKERSGYRYLEDLGTRPTVYYLPPVNRSFPAEIGFDGLDEEVSDRYKNTSLYNKLKEDGKL